MLHFLTPIKSFAANWTPADESNQLFWFKADSLSLSNNDPVSAWVNSFGDSSRDASSSGSNRPTYKTGGLNGKPYLSFNASNFMEYGTNNDFTPGNNFCIFMLIQVQSTGGTWYRTLISVRTPTSNNHFVFMASNDASYGQIWWGVPSGGGVAMIGVATADFTSNPTTGSVSYNGGSVTSAGSWVAKRNGADLTEAALGGLGSAHNDHKNYIGSWPNTAPPSFGFADKVYEIFAFSKAADAALYANVADYWSRKYGA